MIHKLTMRAYAKLNLALDLLARRQDGYHQLETVYTRISLCDYVTIKKISGSDIIIKSDLSFLPTDSRNICHKAAAAFFDRCSVKDRGVYIRLKKYIPVGAGLGGGSSDGAATLLCLNRMYGGPLDKAELTDIAKGLGADPPFFITGGTAFGAGTGADIQPLGPLMRCYFVLVKPRHSLSTAVVFGKTCPQTDFGTTSARAVRKAIEVGRLDDMVKNMYNALERAAFSVCGYLGDIKAELLKAGALTSMMTGTGSCIFGVFDSFKKASGAYYQLQKKYKSGVFIAKPF